MSQNPPLFLLSADEKFDGANWVAFKMTLTEAARGRGLIGYLTGEIKNSQTQTPPNQKAKEATDEKGAAPDPTPTTWWGALNPMPDEWMQHDAYARSMITLNVVNPIGARVKMDGSAADAWASLTAIHDAKSDLGLLHAEEELNAIKYADGSNIEAHFKALRTVWAKANDQGAGIDNHQFRAYVIKSMPSSWAAVTGSLVNEGTSAEVIVHLTMHTLLLHGVSAISPAKLVQALATQIGWRDKGTCTNPSCGRVGHTIDQCFKKGGGMHQ